MRMRQITYYKKKKKKNTVIRGVLIRDETFNRANTVCEFLLHYSMKHSQSNVRHAKTLLKYSPDFTHLMLFMLPLTTVVSMSSTASRSDGVKSTRVILFFTMNRHSSIGS